MTNTQQTTFNRNSNSDAGAHLPVLNVGQDLQFFSPIKGGVQEYETVPVHAHKLVDPLQESGFPKTARDVLRFYQQESSAWDKHCHFRSGIILSLTGIKWQQTERKRLLTTCNALLLLHTKCLPSVCVTRVAELTIKLPWTYYYSIALLIVSTWVRCFPNSGYCSKTSVLFGTKARCIPRLN